MSESMCSLAHMFGYIASDWNVGGTRVIMHALAARHAAPRTITCLVLAGLEHAPYGSRPMFCAIRLLPDGVSLLGLQGGPPRPSAQAMNRSSCSWVRCRCLGSTHSTTGEPTIRAPSKALETLHKALGAHTYNGPSGTHSLLGSGKNWPRPLSAIGRAATIWEAFVVPEELEHLEWVVLGITLTLTPTEEGGRHKVLGVSGQPYKPYSYRPNWGLPSMTGTDQTRAMVLSLGDVPLAPGEAARAVIVPFAPGSLPLWQKVRPGDRLERPLEAREHSRQGGCRSGGQPLKLVDLGSVVLLTHSTAVGPLGFDLPLLTSSFVSGGEGGI